MSVRIVNYRNTEFTGGELMMIAESAGTDAAGNRGITAVNGGDGGGVGGVSDAGGIVEETVGHDHSVCVGEIKKVVNGEWLAGLLVTAAVPLLLRRELVTAGDAMKATDKVLRHFH